MSMTRHSQVAKRYAEALFASLAGSDHVHPVLVKSFKRLSLS